MSMLLDALRKSEARARQSSLVDRLVDIPSSGPEDPSGNMDWLWLAGSLVLALALLLGLNWIQHGQPRPLYPAEPALASDAPATPVPDPTAPGTASAATAGLSSNRPAAKQVPKPAANPQPASPVAVLVERPAAQADSSVPAAGMQSAGASDTPASQPVPATRQLESAKPSPGLLASAANSQAAAASIAEPAAATAQPSASATSAPAGTAVVAGTQTAAAEPIGYWQLPASVRGSLPELRIRVLVYSGNPADRFLILNGQRMVEGDQGPGELRLLEIRRDGGLFAYRAYRFLLQQ